VLLLQFIASNIGITAHHDQQALVEKIDSITRELDEEKNTSERAKREITARAEQERNNANQLRDELNRLKTKLDEMKLEADKEKIKLELQIKELWKKREFAEKEVEELKVQLQMTEDKVDGLQEQLNNTIKELADGILASFSPLFLISPITRARLS